MGKCEECCIISEARQEYKDNTRQKLLTELHALHRSSYMSERLHYYKRRDDSEQFPQDYMSLIIDVMSTFSCKVPQMGQSMDFGAALPQTLMGVINHGQAFTVYRSFHTTKKTGSMVAFAILREVERWMALNPGKSLPHTLYLQIDGGPENCNKTVLAICALLAARKVFKHVVLSRLPVSS